MNSITETATVEVATKPFKLVVLEGSLYFTISALSPVVLVLEGDKVLDTRHVVALVLAGLVAGCTSLKAFFSQSNSSK